jgi:membrane protein DedA with SNARE-associated domain
MDRILDILLNFSGPMPYLVVFGILMACGLGLPIPEDITLFAAGLSAYYGITNLWVVITVAYVGVLLGDSIIFSLGAIYGSKLTKKWFFHKILPEERLNMVQAEFHKRGSRLIFAARFMPGLRAPVYFSAGTLHLPIRVFLFYDGLAALVSVPLIIGAVFYFGDELDKVVRIIQRVEHGIIFVIVAIALAILGKWYITHRKLKQV